jgi:hypothetical protein
MQGQANRREPGQMRLSAKSVEVNVHFRRARRCLQLARRRHLAAQLRLPPRELPIRLGTSAWHKGPVTAESLSIDPPGDARGVLRRVFGHAAFKGLQAPVIGEVLGEW